MREATDLGISAGVRRELAGRRIDLSKIKFPVKAGVVTLQGELCFVGIEKNIDETAVELKFIESSLKMIAGVQELVFELTNWSKNDSNVWESSQSSPSFSGGQPSSPLMAGDGLVCPDCDYVIRFCPCCGKPLSAAGKQAAKGQRKPGLPVKPVLKKKKPVTAFSSPVVAAPVIGSADLLKKSPGMPVSQPQPVPSTRPPEPAIAKPAVQSTPARPVPPTQPAAPSRAPVSPPVFPAKPATTAIPAQPAKPATIPVQPKAPVPPAQPVKTAPATPPVRPIQPAVTHPAPVAPATAKTSVPSMPPQEPDSEPDFADFNPDSAADNVKPSHQPAAKDVPAFNFDDLLSSSETEPADSGADNNGGLPSFDLGSLGDFNATPATPPAKNKPALSLIPDPDPIEDSVEDLLPPLKILPVDQNNPAAQLCSFEPAAADPFNLDEETPLPPAKPAHFSKEPAFDEDTPLPPMKGPQADPMAFEDEDTPLPPMKPRTPSAKESKDPFAALFSETEMNLGLPGEGKASGKDPFSSLDLDLDVLEVFPSSDQAEPVAKPAKKPGQPAGKPAPADDNPFNLDNVIDLDSPVDNKAKSKPKTGKDPFDLDDFDISKFKL